MRRNQELVFWWDGLQRDELQFLSMVEKDVDTGADTHLGHSMVPEVVRRSALMADTAAHTCPVVVPCSPFLRLPQSVRHVELVRVFENSDDSTACSADAKEIRLADPGEAFLAELVAENNTLGCREERSLGGADLVAL